MERRGLVRALAATVLVGTTPALLAAIGPPAAPEDLTWVACPVARPDAAVRCGVLRVPENWRTGQGRRIGISFAVLPAQSPTERRPDAVLFLSGGPGVSAFEPLERFARSPLRAKRDIVIIELRGYGYSDPALTCDGVAQLPDCYRAAKMAGIDPDQYGTESALHDAEALRRALKFVPWNVYGVSYGSFALLHYARLYPEGVRTMLLDSTYPPNAGYQWSLQSGVNAIQKLLDDCGADPACNRAFPNLEQRFFAQLRRLADAPERFAGSAVTAERVLDRVYSQVYDSRVLAAVPRLIDAAIRSEWGLVFPTPSAPVRADGYEWRRHDAQGLNAAVMCADDIFFPADPRLGIAFRKPWPADILSRLHTEGWDYDRRCAAWPVRRSGPELNATVVSSVPALLLAGAYDPITPPSFAYAAAETLANSTVAVFPTLAHAVVIWAFDSCAFRLAEAFFEAPMVKPDLACLAEAKSVRWVTTP